MQTQPSVVAYTINQLRVDSHMHYSRDGRVSGDVQRSKSVTYEDAFQL